MICIHTQLKGKQPFNYMTNEGYLKQDNKENQCKATLSPNRNEKE